MSISSSKSARDKQYKNNDPNNDACRQKCIHNLIILLFVIIFSISFSDEPRRQHQGPLSY